MTTAQRLQLARAFERLAERLAAQPPNEEGRPVTPPHPIITARKSRMVNRTSRRGPYRRREKYIAE